MSQSFPKHVLISRKGFPKGCRNISFGASDIIAINLNELADDSPAYYVKGHDVREALKRMIDELKDAGGIVKVVK